MKIQVLVLFSIISICGWCSGNEDEVFVPDSEWKEIKQGEKIPAGLHVRINLETGKKEAKLINEPLDKRQALSVVEEKNQDDEKTKSEIPFSDLKETLKKIKNDENERPSKIKNKFRSYEEIKMELDDLHLTPRLDSEIIQELISDFKKEFSQASNNNTKLIKILEDLEYLAHQIDNAIDFVNQNGFNDIIYKTLNNTDLKLKESSLRLMSSLMQNNPKVQIHGLETGAIRELLKILSLEPNSNIKYQSIGALSSMLRRFPFAQKNFVDNGGLSVLMQIMQEDNVKINIKIATLLVDLVSEHQYAKNNEDGKEALIQYEQIEIEEKLLKHSFCDNINKLLYVLVSTDENNHDFIEKCLRSMNILIKNCGNSYDVKILNYLSVKYNKLGIADIDEDEEDSSSSYFSELKELCDNLVKDNQVKTEL